MNIFIVLDWVSNKISFITFYLRFKVVSWILCEEYDGKIGDVEIKFNEYLLKKFIRQSDKICKKIENSKEKDKKRKKITDKDLDNIIEMIKKKPDLLYFVSKLRKRGNLTKNDYQKIKYEFNK